MLQFISSCASEDKFGRGTSSAGLPPHLRPKLAANQTSGSESDLHGCCPQGFPYLHRVQSGGANCYIVPLFSSVAFDYWVTSLEPLTRFINAINDLLSFPKEILNEDEEVELNYVSLNVLARRQARMPSRFSKVPGSLWTYRDAICEMMEDTFAACHQLDKAFIEFAK